MIIQVHDELVFDVYKPELETVKEIVKTCMEGAVKLKIPIEVDMGAGTIGWRLIKIGNDIKKGLLKQPFLNISRINHTVQISFSFLSRCSSTFLL